MEAPESLKYSIDYATRDAISGWALDEKGPVNVSVVINGERAPLTVQRIMRDDVANAFPSTPNAAQSGSRILLPVERLAQSPVAEVGLSIGKESVRLELPSASMTNDAAVEFWRGKQSPLPPDVMALVENTSSIDWRQKNTYSEELIGEAVEV